MISDDTSPRPDVITKIEQDLHSSMFPTDEDLAEHFAEDLSLPKPYKNADVGTIKDDIDIEVNDCQIALGRCIMKDEGEKCICEQIKKGNDYDFTPIETKSINKLSDEINDCKAMECCGGSCGVQKDNFVSKDDVPEMVYKTDGTVKIKEFLNAEAVIPEHYNNDSANIKEFQELEVSRLSFDTKCGRDANNDNKFIPFNSCKDVLGNCIVSGNSTMGEGCLCARMIVDDAMNAQEIEDIMPHPKGGLPLVI